MKTKEETRAWLREEIEALEGRLFIHKRALHLVEINTSMHFALQALHNNKEQYISPLTRTIYQSIIDEIRKG